MDMELINKIEAKISELETQFKKNSDFVSIADSNIDKLMSDKTAATNECLGINGAVQMARAVLAEIRSAFRTETKDEIKPIE